MINFIDVECLDLLLEIDIQSWYSVIQINCYFQNSKIIFTIPPRPTSIYRPPMWRNTKEIHLFARKSIFNINSLYSMCNFQKEDQIPTESCRTTIQNSQQS